MASYSRYPVPNWPAILPEDWRSGRFVGRVLTEDGPSPLFVEHGIAFDMSTVAPTVAQLLSERSFHGEAGICLGDLDQLSLPLLSPVDLHCVKACGVTFGVSAVERVIEERARGDASAASTIRRLLEQLIGGSIRHLVPGSEAAAQLKAALIEEGLWSQYLEVAIGPDAEIFTKAPVLASVGAGAVIGIRSDSSWNNPEPEIVLVADPAGEALGATLGNDVNLRDFEGRSALLLGKAKDNNASCAIGPLIRLFGDGFSIDDVRAAEVTLTVAGMDGYRLDGTSNMEEISRDPLDLIDQAMSEHDYPDGFALFLGTLFAPVQDRDEPGGGFTHKEGDLVTIASPRLGSLVNRVSTSAAAPPWTDGISSLMRNLARRGLLG